MSIPRGGVGAVSDQAQDLAIPVHTGRNAGGGVDLVQVGLPLRQAVLQSGLHAIAFALLLLAAQDHIQPASHQRRQQAPDRHDHRQRREQRLGAEVSRHGDVEVRLEVLADPLLRRVLVAVRNPGVGVVDAPDVEWEPLAHVPEHDLQSRMLVQQPGPHQAERVYGGLLPEGPRRAHEPRMAVIDLRPAGDRVARMQIEGHVEFLHDQARGVQAMTIMMFLQGLKSFLTVTAYRKMTSLPSRLEALE